ncbi:MAG: PKD domain-containing protein, partial [Rhodospirillales bacterium]
SGTAGIPVTFDGSGSSDPDGTIVAYEWDFGDGGTGTGVNPSHAYDAAGTYTVSLTVTDDDGATDTASTTAAIEAPRAIPPVADANGPYSGTAGIPVTFDGSGSSDPDGTIVTYEWDFGDGGTGTGVSPSYAYAVDGTYTVTLTVTDDGGNTDTASTTATIDPVVPAIILVKPLVVDFGIVAVGGSTQRMVTVKNDGGSVLEVQDLVLSGSPAFTIVSAPGLPGPLDPGVSVDVVLSYEPAAATSDSGSLQIDSNDPPTVTVTLSGQGQEMVAGKDVYDMWCAGCHGDPFDDAPAPFRKVPGARECLTDAAIWGNPGARDGDDHHSSDERDDEADSPFPDGVPEMQFLQGLLGDPEIMLISDYLNSQPVSGMQRYVTTCAGCHGIDARGGFVDEDVRDTDAEDTAEAIWDEDAMRFLECLPDSDIMQIGDYLERRDDDHHDDDHHDDEHRDEWRYSSRD